MKMTSSKVIVVGMLEGTRLHIPFHICLNLSVVYVTKKKKTKKPTHTLPKKTQNPKTKAKKPSKPTNKTNKKGQNLWVEGSPGSSKTSAQDMNAAKVKSGWQ